MPNVRHFTDKDNQKVVLTDDGDTITTNGGLLSVAQFCEASGIFSSFRDTIEFKDYRKLPLYDNYNLLEQYLLQHIAGYLTDSAANSLRHDPLFQLLYGKVLATQSTFSRFLGRASDLHTLKTLHTALESVAATYINRQANSFLILDIDSTFSATYGHQEGAAYNTHYDKCALNPLLIAEATSGGMLVDAQLRSGDTYTSAEAAAFLSEGLTRYASHPLVVRGDSGFAVPKLYDLVEDRMKMYVFRLKANCRLFDMAQAKFENDPDVDPHKANDVHYYTIQYRAYTWREARKVIVMATRDQQLVPHYQYFVTNLPLTPQDVVAAYRQRGTMENYIKEAKNGYGFDRTNSTDFFTNEVRMVMASIAYNIMKRMAAEVLPSSEKQKSIDSLRLDLFRIGARFTSHAGVLTIHYTTSNPQNALFWHVYDNITRLREQACPSAAQAA
ncbi:IS1380 family transposase [Schleiferilactobacillus shenzhenensis]|uniref:Transposase DDE domain-containing protein n=1 Tax=Schleiferilactobacillus shenzhenensis LY-73 TaxID=1231336 RepID=U4TKA7_9LACO|nr:IS1380 family transposase [Schleiferilactobacillus shenzhenensis]ERL63800.1 hypothetical protein L248_2160 [Schleiferilactobacillus shenzhenensis LY-73]